MAAAVAPIDYVKLKLAEIDVDKIMIHRPSTDSMGSTFRITYGDDHTRLMIMLTDVPRFTFGASPSVSAGKVTAMGVSICCNKKPGADIVTSDGVHIPTVDDVDELKVVMDKIDAKIVATILDKTSEWGLNEYTAAQLVNTKNGDKSIYKGSCSRDYKAVPGSASMKREDRAYSSKIKTKIGLKAGAVLSMLPSGKMSVTGEFETEFQFLERIPALDATSNQVILKGIPQFATVPMMVTPKAFGVFKEIKRKDLTFYQMEKEDRPLSMFVNCNVKAMVHLDSIYYASQLKIYVTRMRVKRLQIIARSTMPTTEGLDEDDTIPTEKDVYALSGMDNAAVDYST